MKRAFIDTPEGQIHFRTEGRGEPVLLLHKASLSSEEYKEMIPILAKNYRVIAIDVLGCGDSDQPPFEPKFEDYVRNIIYCLDSLKIKKTHIVGRLFGASLAIEIAAIYPERVNKLVLCDCLCVEPELLRTHQEEYRDETVRFKENGSHLIEVWKSRGGKPQANLEMVQRATVEYLKSGLGARAGESHRAKFSFDVTPKLPQIKSPVLLLYSQRSGLYPRLEATKNLIQKCYALFIDGTAAFPTWEKPEEYSQTIIKFLRSDDAF